MADTYDLNAPQPSLPPSWHFAKMAYRDAFYALRAMPAIAAAALAIGLAQSAVQLLSPQALQQEYFVVGLALMTVWSLLVTPVLIAIHRFILLGEATHDYRIGSTSRYWLFFQLSFYFNAAATLSGAISQVLVGVHTTLFLLALPVFILLVFVALRLTLLFPAIAVDAAGASWRNAYQDTKSYVLRILATFILVSVPLLIPLGITIWLQGLQPSHSEIDLSSVVGVVISAIASVFSLAVFVAVASRYYQWIGRRLKQAE